MKDRDKAGAITVQNLMPQHLPLLHAWLQQPHVREFWDDGHRTPQQVRAHYFDPQRDALAWIVALDAQPIAYAQAYPVPGDSEYAPWRSEMGETWGIDLFIGEVRWLGRGLAVPIIRALVGHLRHRRPETSRVVIDPESSNTRARHIYAKAGFRTVGSTTHLDRALEIMALDV